MGTKFYLRVAGAVLVCGVAVFVIMALITRVWYAAGVLGAFVLVFGGLLVFAWVYDRHEKARYADE